MPYPLCSRKTRFGTCTTWKLCKSCTQFLVGAPWPQAIGKEPDIQGWSTRLCSLTWMFLLFPSAAAHSEVCKQCVHILSGQKPVSRGAQEPEPPFLSSLTHFSLLHLLINFFWKYILLAYNTIPSTVSSPSTPSNSLSCLLSLRPAPLRFLLQERAGLQDTTTKHSSTRYNKTR